jgi:hypothetical protein
MVMLIGSLFIPLLKIDTDECLATGILSAPVTHRRYDFLSSHGSVLMMPLAGRCWFYLIYNLVVVAGLRNK